MRDQDQRLLNYVTQEIHSGKTEIVVPWKIARGTSEKAREVVREKCRINHVDLQIKL